MIIIDLIYNLALLAALSAISGFVGQRWPSGRRGALLQGVVFGSAAVIGMLNPLALGPGLMFDGRSVVISLCGFFFGPAAVGVAGGLAVLCRIYQGGQGAFTGVLVVLSSVLLGLVFHAGRIRRGAAATSGLLYVFGLLVHAAMLLLMFTLPHGQGFAVLKKIGLPVLLAYPLATVLIGRILADQIGRAGFLEALRAGAEKFRTTLYSIGDAVITTDTAGRVRELNPVAQGLTGWSEADARGRSLEEVFRIISEQTRVAVESPAARVLREGQVVGLANHTLLIARDGTERPIADSGAPIRDAGGAVAGVVLVFRDQTRERAVDAALRALSQHQDALLSAIPEIVMEVDNNKVYTWANPAGLAFFGDDVIGREAAFFFDGKQGVYEEIQPLFNGYESVLCVESWQRRRDGEKRLLRWWCRVLKDAKGQVTGALSTARDITELKQAEKKLQESEAKHRTLFETMAQGVVYQADDGRIMEANPAAERILGLTLDQMQGHASVDPLWKTLREDGSDYPGEQHPSMVALRTGREVRDSVMAVFNPRAKAYTWISICAVPQFRPGESRPCQVYTTFSDITERRRAEEQYRTLFNEMLDGFAAHEILCDPAGRPVDYRFLAVNPAFERMTGLQAGQIIGKTVREVLPEIEEHWIETYGRVALTGDPAHFESHAVSLDRHFEVTAYRPQPNQFACIFMDITERKRAEADLKRIEWMLSKKPASPKEKQEGLPGRGYGDLTALNPGGLILKSLGRDMLRQITADYLDLLGTSSAVYEANGDYAFGIFDSGWCHLLDQASRQLCHTGDNAAALASGRWLCHESCWTRCSKEAIATRVPVDVECHGGLRLYAVPIFARNEVVGAINFGYGDPPRDPAKLRELAAAYGLAGEDLTREAGAYNSRPLYIIEMAKERLLASARLIGMRVEAGQAEDAREKLEAQLRQSQKMEAVGRLAGGVAHDFNNMLQVILGHTEFLLAGIRSDDARAGDLQEISRAAHRSADLTRQLLAFARKQTIAPQVLDLNAAIADMLKMLRRLIGEDIDLLWKPSPDSWTVEMDLSQLNQALTNLAVNARDAIAGVGRMTIETSPVTVAKEEAREPSGFPPGEYILLAVSDDGCGMSKETLAHIFEPFFTTKPQGQGSGLGLATVYGIVRQNKGIINVYSEVGKGTTFKIYLPRCAESAAATGAPADATPSPTGVETILLVEDEPALLALAHRMLKQLGYTVLAAAGPGEALRLAAAHPGRVDLLLTDVVMPEMSGRQLWDRLIKVRPGLNPLYMSGYTANVIAHHGILDEGVQFLQKPFSRDELARKVRAVLAGP